jgi:hypothetical protein
VGLAPRAGANGGPSSRDAGGPGFCFATLGSPMKAMIIIRPPHSEQARKSISKTFAVK